MEHVSVDLWAANLQVTPDSLQSWLASVELRLQQAAAREANFWKSVLPSSSERASMKGCAAFAFATALSWSTFHVVGEPGSVVAN